VTNALEAHTPAAIAKMDDLGEITQAAGMADGIAAFYAAQDSHENVQHALEISLRLKRRAGAILLPPSEGGKTARAKGARTDRTSAATPRRFQDALNDAGIHHETASKWQSLARVPDKKFEGYLAEAFAWDDNYSIAQVMKYAGEFYGRSDSPEWGTPQWLFDLLHQEFRFELDVCATAENAKCKRYFTQDDDGLLKDWAPRRCWMNPPYGGEIGGWMQKAVQESKKGALVACLIPARPDTNWWWENALQGEMRFIRGRLVWQDGGTPAPFPSAVVILSPEHKRKVVWWDIRER